MYFSMYQLIILRLFAKSFKWDYYNIILEGLKGHQNLICYDSMELVKKQTITELWIVLLTP